MKCPKCKREFRIGQEQIGVNEQNMPILKTFCYCDYCRIKYDYEATLKTQPKKDSALSIWAAILAFFTCTCFIGGILGIIDLCMNDKEKRHIGSWFAIAFCVLWTIVLISTAGESENDRPQSNNINQVTEQSVVQQTSTQQLSEEFLNEESKEEIVYEIELSEEEYKELCKEMYYDDFFSESANASVGDYVKFNGFISGKAQYYYSDTFAMVIDDIDEIYNFRREYMGSCVMHKETKDDLLPSYLGKSVYLMFPENSELNIENYEAGQHCIIYGEVVQTWSGIFIIPKYIEIQ